MQALTLTARKQALRTECLAIRAALSPTERAEADAALCRAVAALPEFCEATLLLCYAPARGEPDLTPLYRLCLERGIAIAFPRCVGKEMHFHTVDALDALVEGRFGILAPTEDAPRAILTPRTLCVLPALAATKSGARLGYGGGYYDRFLPNFPGRTVLPIYERLIRPSLPQEPTDRPADIIITEKGDLCRA